MNRSRIVIDESFGKATSLEWSAAAIVGALLIWDPWGLVRFQALKLAVVSTSVTVGVIHLVRTGHRIIGRWLRPLVALLVVLLLASITSDSLARSLIGAPFRSYGLLSWLVVAGALLVGEALGTSERSTIRTERIVVVVVESLLRELSSNGSEPFRGRSGAAADPFQHSAQQVSLARS